ncbi:hypothetical protein PPACK8108_LOCUS22473 [Phakopsora pachyrhizi]|uniref:Uncharacterized protein n=1 Tax=Phakopsora pachyrhizi TaxID=170000 RepID=A0AAV0BNQ8_PHAPC|nr:hypothetical protein PPACK8108_LOCUS22473 [Phakopsora pachyrhizi]
MMGLSQKNSKIKSQSCLELSKKHSNQLMREILSLIEKKKSNLCIPINVTEKKKLIEITEIVGQHVCMIKVINQLDKERIGKK